MGAEGPAREVGRDGREPVELLVDGVERHQRGEAQDPEGHREQDRERAWPQRRPQAGGPDGDDDGHEDGGVKGEPGRDQVLDHGQLAEHRLGEPRAAGGGAARPDAGLAGHRQRSSEAEQEGQAGHDPRHHHGALRSSPDHDGEDGEDERDAEVGHVLPGERREALGEAAQRPRCERQAVGRQHERQQIGPVGLGHQLDRAADRARTSEQEPDGPGQRHDGDAPGDRRRTGLVGDPAAHRPDDEEGHHGGHHRHQHGSGQQLGGDEELRHHQRAEHHAAAPWGDLAASQPDEHDEEQRDQEGDAQLQVEVGRALELIGPEPDDGAAGEGRRPPADELAQQHVARHRRQRHRGDHGEVEADRRAGECGHRPQQDAEQRLAGVDQKVQPARVVEQRVEEGVVQPADGPRHPTEEVQVQVGVSTGVDDRADAGREQGDPHRHAGEHVETDDREPGGGAAPARGRRRRRGWQPARGRASGVARRGGGAHHP